MAIKNKDVQRIERMKVCKVNRELIAERKICGCHVIHINNIYRSERMSVL